MEEIYKWVIGMWIVALFGLILYLIKKHNKKKDYEVKKRVYCKLKCEVENHPKEGCVFKYSSLEYIKKIKNSDCRRLPKTIERSFINNQHNKKD